MFLETIYSPKILYFFTLWILTTGLFIMLSSDNYVRKIIGLSVMQSSVLIFYLILGKVNGGTVPIERNSSQAINQKESSRKEVVSSLESPILISSPSITAQYSSPVPQVLMLTAIVVGFATLSVGLALIYRISQQFSTICESKILAAKILELKLPEPKVLYNEMAEK